MNTDQDSTDARTPVVLVLVIVIGPASAVVEYEYEHEHRCAAQEHLSALRAGSVFIGGWNSGGAAG